MLPCKIDLTGKVAVVTGGSGVLCSEMAKALAACGAKVAVLSRTLENVETVAHEIEEAGGIAMGISCDVLSRESLQEAEKQIHEAWGPCDILINGAGGNHPKGTASLETLKPEDLKNGTEGSFFDLESEGIGFVFDLNYQGTVLASQIFAKDMAARETGCVINLSSMSAYNPLTKVMSYSGAKAAVNSFTEWLAVHLAPCGVRVNAIAPGFFLTSQNESLLLDEEGKPSARCQKILSQTPMNRLGKAEELIGALLFLASDEMSGFVTGTVIPVDGGFAAYRGV